MATLLIENADERLNFLPKFFGIRSVIVEQAVYKYAQRYIEGYKGGFWKFFQAGKAPLMVWDHDEEVTLYTEFTSFDTNVQTASLAVMMLSLNHLTWAIYKKHEAFARELQKVYDDLRDWLYSDATEDEVKAFGIDRNVVWNMLD